MTFTIIIRDFEPEDTDAFIEMASDGSLGEIFGDCKDCRSWMGDWIEEAKELCTADNPFKEYLAYAVVDKKKKVPVGSVGG